MPVMSIKLAVETWADSYFVYFYAQIHSQKRSSVNAVSGLSALWFRVECAHRYAIELNLNLSSAKAEVAPIVTAPDARLLC